MDISPWPHVRATVRCPSPPAWAVAERNLFDLLEQAWRVFEKRYCDESGRLVYLGGFDSRDGVDDFYEAFFNWPLLHVLGGSDELLDAARTHWEAVGVQLGEAGMLSAGYEVGYDWFHQGESMLMFYFLCLARPTDVSLREMAMRFADLYLGGPPYNYDPVVNVIRAPHTGAKGPRWGLVDGDPSYPWNTAEAAAYGPPLDWIEEASSIETLLADPVRARAMGIEIRDRMGRGDVAINLAATGLATNAFLLTGESRFRDWVLRYVDGWLTRATENQGILPDNVGLSGVVGEYLDGRWYGGHYGWSWPHGLHTVGAAAIIASINASLLTSDDSYLELGRRPLDLAYSQGISVPFNDRPATSMPGRWAPYLDWVSSDALTFVVPNRVCDTGWFDYQPAQVSFPMALWQFSYSEADRARVDALREASGHDWRRVSTFRDKEEAGHEEPFFAYLMGDNPSYPDTVLQMAATQIAGRLDKIAADDSKPDEISIHHWQDHNPVVTEALVQLTLGTPQALYNGGLLQARVRYYDAQTHRPGLPPGVSALVESIDPRSTIVQLVNCESTERRVVIQAGTFAEHRIERAIVAPGDGSQRSTGDSEACEIPVSGPFLEVVLPPASKIRMALSITLRALPPSYRGPWDSPELFGLGEPDLEAAALTDD